MVEMGVGRAGGYAGYDDDEFEEIGGSQAAGRVGTSGKGAGPGAGGDGGGGGRVGFRIGDEITGHQGKRGDDSGSDLFAGTSGRAVSLQTGTLQSASDFMTHDEAEAEPTAAGTRST